MTYAEFCDMFKTCFDRNEELAHGVAHNAIRDWIWTYLSYSLLNIRLHVTADANFDSTGQWAGQQFYATLGMVIFAIASKGAYIAYNATHKQTPFSDSEETPLQSFTTRTQQPTETPFPTANVAAIIAGAAFSIYTWDRGQVLGIQIGTRFGLSAESAGYFASIFTGGLEGPTQMIAITLAKLLMKNEEWSQFKNDPKAYLASKAKELGLSMTLGAIPGAVWQIVFNAGVLASLGPIATSIAVAVAVAVCNVIYAKISAKILASECCTNLCDQPAANNTTHAVQEMAPCSALLSCMFSMFDRTNAPAAATTVPRKYGDAAMK